jgi:hypothetical protein
MEDEIMFGIFDSISKTVEDFVDDPIGTSVDIVTKPIRDAADVIDGLTEMELREEAILRLGADVVGGMGLSEIVSWYTES